MKRSCNDTNGMTFVKNEDFINFIEIYNGDSHHSTPRKILELSKLLIDILSNSPSFYSVALTTIDTGGKVDLTYSAWKFIAIFKALSSTRVKNVTEFIINEQLYDENEDIDLVVKSLSDMLKCNSNLRHLSIFHDGATNVKTATKIAEGLMINKNIKYLEYSGGVTTESAYIILNASYANHLRVDNLLNRYDENDDELVMKLASFIKANQNVLTLESICPEGDLEVIDSRPIAEALKHNNNLYSLKLSCNPCEVGQDEVDCFVETLKKDNFTLTELFPYHCDMSDYKQELSVRLQKHKKSMFDAVKDLCTLDLTLKAKISDIHNFLIYEKLGRELVSNLFKMHIGNEEKMISGRMIFDDALMQEAREKLEGVDNYRSQNFSLLRGIAKNVDSVTTPNMNDLLKIIAPYCELSTNTLFELSKTTELVGDEMQG